MRKGLREIFRCVKAAVAIWRVLPDAATGMVTDKAMVWCQRKYHFRIWLVISRPNHRPIYQPAAHLSHITAVIHCILLPLTPADRQPNACGTADRGSGCT